MNDVAQGAMFALIEVDSDTRIFTMLSNVTLKKQHYQSYFRLSGEDHFTKCDNIVIGNTSGIINQFVKTKS